MFQDDTSSRVWVCTSTHSSTKVMVLDASQPSDLLDSFYACNTHVVCIASVPGMAALQHLCFESLSLEGGRQSVVLSSSSLPGVLESDYPAGEEVHQDLESSQGDRVSLAGSVASVGSTGSDGALAAEGTTAVPQTAGSGSMEQPAEQGLCPGSGTVFLFIILSKSIKCHLSVEHSGGSN